MSAKEALRIKMAVFDIDGVIIPKGTEIHENIDGTEFEMRTHKLSKNFVENVRKLKKYVRVDFSSGRSLLYLRSLVKDFFDRDVILQTENGALSFLDGEIIHPDFPNDYFELVYKLKDLVQENRDKLQVEGFEPKLFILTVHAAEENRLFYDLVKKVDTHGILSCVWGGEAYDVSLKGVTKGQMLAEISQRLGLKSAEVLTTGNAMNDKEMLEFGVGVTAEPDVVWGRYKSSGKKLCGEEVAEFLVKKFENK
ncbi:MAG: HAD family phosphatase [Candidatus Micrarchaeota archaeon]|nr:HAD family phosphatase [Candidatus Micrarchaeota archaeon]